MIVAVLLLACERDPSGPADKPSDSFTADADFNCDVPGTVCRWLGVPGVGSLSGEGTDRSDDILTGTHLFYPLDITFTADDTAYYPDFHNHRIRHVDSHGFVWTVAGTLLGTSLCWEGCPALDAMVHRPTSVAIGASDPTSLWVASEGVDRVDLSAGLLYTWFRPTYTLEPTSIVVADDGTVYVASSYEPYVDGEILRVSAEGLVETIVHAPDVIEPRGLTLDGDVLWFADTGAGRVRTIDLAACSADLSACEVSDVSDINGFARPTDVAIGPSGEVYVTDTELDCVRILRSDGTVEPFAGVCTEHGYAGDGGPATEALFADPFGVAVDPAGNVYVADSGNHVIRRIVPPL